MNRWRGYLSAVLLAMLAGWWLNRSCSDDAPDPTLIAGTQSTERPDSATGVAQASRQAGEEKLADAGPTSAKESASGHVDAAEIVTAPGSASPGTAVDARAQMRAWRRRADCQLALTQELPGQRRRFEQELLRWLPEDQAGQEREQRDSAIARMTEACDRREFAEADGRMVARVPRRGPPAQALREGDLLARLEQARRELERGGEASLAETRSLLELVAGSGDSEAIAMIGELLFRAASGRRQLGVASEYSDPRPVWMLVACQHGLPCGPGSLALDRVCLGQGVCSASDVAAALQQAHTARQFAHWQEQARTLSDRIRDGRSAGLFDPLGDGP